MVVAAGVLKAAAGQTAGPRLRLALDEVLRGAQLPANLDGFDGIPADEVIAGEHLRQNAGQVSLFSLVPAP